MSETTISQVADQVATDADTIVGSAPPAPGNVVATPLQRGLAAIRLEADDILERITDALNDAADDLDRLGGEADDLDREHRELGDDDDDAEADRVEEVTALIERIEELSSELQSFAAELQL